MAHSPSRIDLIRKRIPEARPREFQLDWPLATTRTMCWLMVSAVIVCILAFPFTGLSVARIIGMSLLVGVSVGLFGGYLVRFKSKSLDAKGRRLSYAVLILVVMLAARLTVEFCGDLEWYAMAVPVPLAAMVISVVYNQRFAFDSILMLFFLLGAHALVADYGGDTRTMIGAMGTLLLGSVVAVLLTRSLRSRTKLLKVGLAVGLTMAIAMTAFAMLGFWTSSPTTPSPTFWKWAAMALAHGVLTGVVATSLIPVLEYSFGIVSEVRLMELEDGNHPLLRELLERAPGTYMHTQNVARLASAAVEAIGGNALLTRVGTLFHDIGKMVRPEYFTENEPNSKLYHDRLSPAMSGTIIISHVKEGLVIARDHKLPKAIEDFITGHHGTSSVAYFYRMAKMQAYEGERVEEGQFRYPGPKPQSREAAVVAIADLVEAAGRAKLDGPQTPGTLQKFVHECVSIKLQDGQFDECDLTLRDLHTVEKSMVKTLASMYHHRVKYPDDPDARKRKLAILEKEEYRKELAKRREKILTQ